MNGNGRAPKDRYTCARRAASRGVWGRAPQKMLKFRLLLVHSGAVLVLMN